MMEKLIGFIILVAALVLGGYYGMGVLTERAIKKNVDVINQTNGVDVTVTAYQRGLFKSKAMLNWTLNLAKPNDKTTKTVVVNMPLTIVHGPIMITNGKVRFGLGYAASHVTLPIDETVKPTLSLAVFVSYF